ncbi:hypothetical protein, partial [Flavobacterium hydatis]
ITLEDINFKKSIIYTGHKIRKNVEYKKIDNFQGYNEFKNIYPIHDFEKISISKEYLGRDVINIQASVRPFYSERLIDFLLDCNITNLYVSYDKSIELDFC